MALTGIASGKIDGEMVEGGGEAKGEIASDAAGVAGFARIFDEAVEVVVPDDALV